MLMKDRTESDELKTLRLLNSRMILPPNAKNRLANLEKGFQGERMFDQLTKELDSNMLVINDLCLENNQSIYQFDTLIFSYELIYLFEVKNYESDAYYEADSFYTFSNNELKNPLDQLKRNKSFLRQLLRSLGFQLPIEGYAIFINPEFTLYQSPKNSPIIHPTQVNRFIKKLNHSSTKLNAMHMKTADRLIAMHQKHNPYTRLPSYKYEQLTKGIMCPKCNSFITSAVIRKAQCNQYGYKEDIDSVILRSIEDMRLRFPNIIITTNNVYEWCNVIVSRKRVATILKEKLKLKGYGQWTYYE
ncbi:nuclease-related domain-containing protein [Niallia oryzisoli]|uniref:Nuclease-related domain-containing protein n=1 Tax=Niallia oryzisoli TaxID=1737571 RepID=A0ABZ2CI97_9BACI